nr:hypothetical protein [Porphyromonas uenonis]
MKWLRPNDSSANYQDRRGRISGKGLASEVASVVSSSSSPASSLV